MKINWHKYPDEIPNEDCRLIVVRNDEGRRTIHDRMGYRDGIFRSNTIFNLEMEFVTHFAYLDEIELPE